MNDDQHDALVQNTLNKLISDEWFMGNIYQQIPLAIIEPINKNSDMFLSIAKDELQDHMASLSRFAMSKGYKVPLSYNEMKRFASKKNVSTFETLQAGKDITAYVDKLMELEAESVKDYEKYLFDDNQKQIDNDLFVILQSNYYDEIDHLKSLEFLQNQIEAFRKFN